MKAELRSGSFQIQLRRPSLWPRILASLLLLLLLPLLLQACSGGTSPPEAPAPAPTPAAPNSNAPGEAAIVTQGIWGGQGIEMTVYSGGASIVFNCAQGTISQELSLDSSGQFQAQGIYSPNPSSPLQPGSSAQINIPTTYKGKITNSTQMTLTILITATGGSLLQQVYQLTYGTRGSMAYCIYPL